MESGVGRGKFKILVTRQNNLAFRFPAFPWSAHLRALCPPSRGDATAKEPVDLLHAAYLKGVQQLPLCRLSVTHSISEGKLPGCGTLPLATLPEASITLQRGRETIQGLIES